MSLLAQGDRSGARKNVVRLAVTLVQMRRPHRDFHDVDVGDTALATSHDPLNMPKGAPLEKGKGKEAMETLSGFAVGKPVVIEETVPMNCSFPEFEQFLDESKKTVSGWIGFYWGKTPEEYRRSDIIQDALMLGWLEFFQKRAGEAQRAEEARP